MVDSSDYNKPGMAVFLFAMVVTAVFFFYIVFIHEHPSPDYLLNLPKDGASLQKNFLGV